MTEPKTPVGWNAGNPETTAPVEPCPVCKDGTAHVVCKDGKILVSTISDPEKWLEVEDD